MGINKVFNGIWIAVVLFFTSIFFLWQWINTMREEKQFEVNDIKYRSLKVTGDKALIKVLYHTDSLCNISAEHMKESVVQEEEYLIERTKLLQLTGEKEREAEDLRKRAEKK